MATVPSPHHDTLVAATELVVDFSADYQKIEVVSDGAAAVYFTTNGAAATVGGDGCHELPACGGYNSVLVDDERYSQPSKVRLISVGTPKVQVSGANTRDRAIGGSSSGGGGSSSSVKVLDSGGTNTLSVSAGGAAKVDGSAVTQPVSAASLPLPTGAATAAKQDTGNTSVASLDTKTPALGQAASAASRPVVIASDQSAVPVTATSATRSAVTVLQNAATGTGNGTTMSVLGYAEAVVSLSGLSGDTITWEVQADGTATWQAISAHQIGVNGSLSPTATANGDYRIAVTGFNSLRARVSTYGAGTITARGYAIATASKPTAVALASGSNTIGAVTLTDNTNSANVLKSDGTAAGQNAQLVAGTHLASSFTTTTVQAVASTDAANYAWVSVHVVTQGGSSTVTFQASDDNTNWVSVALMSSAGVAQAAASSTTSAGVMFHGPLPGRYFRLNVTGIVSGTTAGVVEFYAAPRAMQTFGGIVSQNGTWTVQPGNTPNTAAWLVQLVAAATGGYSFSHIAANTAGTTVKSGAGTLHSVTINTAGASSNVLTLYDNTAASGTVIAIIDTTTVRTLVFDAAFATGLEAVLATGTAADVTILYK